MRKRVLIYCAVFLLLSAFLPGQANAEPDVSADAAVLMELSTGRVLYEKNAHDPKRIASITKILTAIVAIESGDLDETVTVSKHAVYTEGSSIYLKEGEKILLEDLVYGLMLRSGNDAAVAIAEAVGGSEEGFVQLMNEKAAWIGMTDSHFDNPHGLDTDTHASSAYDMALVTRYAMENETFRKISGSKSYKAENKMYAWGNKNKLLTRLYEYSTGGKTGYTKLAGRTLVSTAEKDGMELVAVTINDPDDWNDHINLFEYGFDTFTMTKLNNQLPETTMEEVIYPLTSQEQQHLSATAFLLNNAPDNEEQPIGQQVYYADGKVIASSAIYKQNAASLFSETIAAFKRLAGAAEW